MNTYTLLGIADYLPFQYVLRLHLAVGDKLHYTYTMDNLFGHIRYPNSISERFYRSITEHQKGQILIEHGAVINYHDVNANTAIFGCGCNRLIKQYHHKMIISREACKAAIIHNHVTTLRLAFRYFPDFYQWDDNDHLKDLFATAARYGRNHIISMMREYFPSFVPYQPDTSKLLYPELRNTEKLRRTSDDVYHLAMDNNHYDTFKLLCKLFGCPKYTHDYVIPSVIHYGTLKIFERYVSEDPELKKNARTRISIAAKFGRLDIIKWLNKQFNYDIIYPGAFEDAAANGHLRVLEYLCDTYSTKSLTSNVFTGGVHSNNMEILRLIRFKIPNLRIDAETFTAAAEIGNMKMIQYLHQEFPKISPEKKVYSVAAKNGRSDVIQLFHQLFPTTKASFQGFIDAMEYGHCQTAFLLGELFPMKKQINRYILRYNDDPFPHSHYVRCHSPEACPLAKMCFPNIRDLYDTIVAHDFEKMKMLMKSLLINDPNITDKHKCIITRDKIFIVAGEYGFTEAIIWLSRMLPTEALSHAFQTAFEYKQCNTLLAMQHFLPSIVKLFTGLLKIRNNDFHITPMMLLMKKHFPELYRLADVAYQRTDDRTYFTVKPYTPPPALMYLHMVHPIPNAPLNLDLHDNITIINIIF